MILKSLGFLEKNLKATEATLQKIITRTKKFKEREVEMEGFMSQP
jgi:hypothetical protein